MPYRKSLHSMINMLADFGVFEGRKVTVEVTNGRDIRWAYDPPLEGAVEREVVGKELSLSGIKPS